MWKRSVVQAVGLALIIVAISGCFSQPKLNDEPLPEPEPEPTPITQAPQPEIRFAGIKLQQQEVANDCGNCWEPTIAAFPDGTVVMTYGGSNPLLYFTLPNGEISTQPVPPLPLGFNAATTGDETVHTDAEGRLYYTALLCTAACGVPGIQVARSDDRGETWAVNEAISPIGDPDELSSGVDRQWLAMEGDTLYLTWSQWAPRTGIWVARSDDAGVSWSNFVRAVPVEEKKHFHSPGDPVISDGRVILPHLAAPNSSMLPGAGKVVRVALSDDQGATWQNVVVYEEEGQAIRWPDAVARGKQVWLVWQNGDGDVKTSYSADGGESWNEPTTVGANAKQPPAIDVHEDYLSIHYIGEKGGKMSVNLHHMPATSGSAAQLITSSDMIVLANSAGTATTDFSHMDVDRYGMPHMVASDGSQLLYFTGQPVWAVV